MYGESIFWQHSDPPVTGDPGDSNVPSHSRFTTGDHDDPHLGGELLDVVDLDNNSWPLTAEGAFIDIPESMVNMGVEQGPPEWMNEPEIYHTNSDQTSLTFTGTSPASETTPLKVPSSDSHAAPIIYSEPFRCSWHPHGSGAQCRHAASDRAAFLRHLGAMHGVFGQQDETITCWLHDDDKTSACNTPIKRGNFPRHSDTHYHIRYFCQLCPAAKSFSRQDSWKKHMKNKHAAILEM